MRGKIGSRDYFYPLDLMFCTRHYSMPRSHWAKNSDGRTRSSSFCRPRIPRKTLGRNLNKSFTVEEPATIGRAEHGNDLALNADVTNFLGCPHNLPFKSSPIGVEKTLVDAPSSSVAGAKLTELLVLVYQTKCIVICAK